MVEITTDEFLTDSQVEIRLQLKPGSLKMRRHHGLDIPFIRIGKRSIRYHWPSVMKHLMGDADKDHAVQKPSRRGRKRIGWDEPAQC